MDQFEAIATRCINKRKAGKICNSVSGGPETPSIEIDPDIAMISPNLMSTASVLFTSNMDDEESESNLYIFNDN